jgi:nicotinate-nucleotide adenylyltransferase
VRYFLTTLRQPATLYLMMGADQFSELDSWKDPEELVRLCNFVVHTRLIKGEEGPARISVAALKRFGYTQEDDHYVHSSGQTLSFVETTYLPIAATDIRAKLQRGESIRYLVPIDVVDYIQRHALY